jgi:uncharacterized protein (TIGR03083 family)
VEISAHLDYLASEGSQLAQAARSAGLSDPVPGCPDWTVRDLAAHVGEVHRWAAAIVTHAVAKPSALPEGAVEAAPGDAELVDWYAAGHAALVDTLRAAPADLSCFTFLPAPSPLAFWARRQAHETAIHRADAFAAAGQPVDFDDALALDGIDEVLHGFATRPRVFEPGTLTIATPDGTPWLITFSADGLTTTAWTGAAADASVSGSPSEVYLWLWNRPSTVTVEGSQEVADRWKQLQVRWS